MALDPNDKRINPEDELFWKKVREAFDLVQPTTGKEIDIEVGTRSAHVFTDEKATYIQVKEIESKAPVLVVP